MNKDTVKEHHEDVSVCVFGVIIVVVVLHGFKHH